MPVTRSMVALALVVLLAGCATDDGTGILIGDLAPTPPTAVSSPTTTGVTTPPTAVSSPTTTGVTAPPSSTAGATTQPDTTNSVVPATTSTTTTPPDTTPYVVPVADVDAAGWGDTHSSYPATDIFAGCGAGVVSPVNGTVLEVRRTDGWDPAVDNPATRGGRSVSILGDDGVRYYLAHFDVVVEPLDVGDRITAGQLLGTMGDTGRSSACHLHVGISSPCPGKEWSVRRGAVWPYPYLDAWRDGEQTSPVDEVAAWAAANPGACSEAMADPYAADS